MWTDIDEKIAMIKQVTGFTPREIFVMTQRYSGRTLSQIGTFFNVSRERIRQIELKSIRIALNKWNPRP